MCDPGVRRRSRTVSLPVQERHGDPTKDGVAWTRIAEVRQLTATVLLQVLSWSGRALFSTMDRPLFTRDLVLCRVTCVPTTEHKS